MIDRFPDGTDAIPYPHKIFHWKDGDTLVVQFDPQEYRRTRFPAIEGWEPRFVGFFGYDRPMDVSYRRTMVTV